MAGRDPGEDRAEESLLAEDRLTGGGHGQTASRWDAEGVHGFADQILAQHGTEGGPTVAPPRIGRRPGPLQLDVEPLTRGRPVFTQQDGPAVAQPGQVAELMPGISLGNWLGAGENLVAGEEGRRIRAGEGGGVESERAG